MYEVCEDIRIRFEGDVVFSGTAVACLRSTGHERKTRTGRLHASSSTIMSDPTSQANYTDIYTQHVSFKWNIDFPNKKITGSATHDLRVSKDQVAEVMLVDRYSPNGYLD